MKCKDVHNKLIFFLEGDLSEAEMKAVQEHLGECRECALFAEELKLTFSILETEKKPGINPFFYTRVKAKLEKQEEQSIERRPVLARVLQPVAFSLILLLAIYGGIKFGATSAEQSESLTVKQELIPYLNEMDVEPIENFLMQ